MSFGFDRSPGRRARRAATALLSLLIATGVVAPAGPVVASVPVGPGVARSGATAAPSADALTFASEEDTPAPVGDTAGLEPSIQYEQAVEHADDKIAFTPGGRVIVGFTPRTGDGWPVGGGAPLALPSGRLDGRAIRDAASGLPERTPAPAGSVDLPSNGAGRVTATTVSYAVPDTDPATAISPQAAITPAGLRREIFGFLPYWEVNSSSLRLDYSKLSTIAYFGLGADAAGNLVKRNSDGSITVGWSGWTSSRLTSIISAAHQSHTRVVLTVQSFGWNSTGLARQKALLGSSTARGTLARQIAAAVRDRGADGVNLDFEPLASGYEAEFTLLVRSVRIELDKVHKGYQLTFDTTGRIGNYPIEDATAPGGADAIFVMGYDYRTAGSSPVGSIAPLDRSIGYDIRETLADYTARVAPSKVILGVPYYGRAWSTADNSLNATNTSSSRTGASTTVVYATAADYLAQYGRIYDPTEGVAWTAYRRQNCTATYGCVTSWRELYVDDAATLGQKYDLVNQYGIRGAGIWALGYDGTRPEMWHAIEVKFIDDFAAPVVGIRTLGIRMVNPAFLVQWTGYDTVQLATSNLERAVDGGAWTTWLTATTATSGVWYGLDGHRYAFRVRARDPKGNVSAWNVSATAPTVGSGLAVGGFGLVRIDGLSVRSAGDTSASRLGTFAAGDLLAIVGGPRSADGYTWWQVTGPLSTWGPVRPTFSGGWVAAATGATTYVTPTKAPNATTVDAYIGDLGWNGAGAASIGTAAGPVGQRTFSPNGDGSKDGMRVDWTNAIDLDSLVLRVFRADATLVGDVPVNQLAAGRRTFTWNGTVGGSQLPDGRYFAALIGTAGRATFYNPINSFRADAYLANRLTIDRVPPKVTSASESGAVLSPNGDGIADSVRASIATADGTSWAFGVAPITGSAVGPPVLVRTGAGGSVSVTWDGRASGGSIVPDGSYRLELLVSDDAGNRVAGAWMVRVDRTPPAITQTAPATFSPNGDGQADTARLAWTAAERVTGVARVWHSGTLIRGWTISGTSGAVTWDGRNGSGSMVADGHYAFQVAARDSAGNLTQTSVAINVDRTLSTLRWSPTAFSPLGHGGLPRTARASFSTIRAASVTMLIYHGATVVRTIMRDAPLGAGAHAWVWDGRNDAGVLVPAGTYVVLVTATSSIGRSSLARAVSVE